MKKLKSLLMIGAVLSFFACDDGNNPESMCGDNFTDLDEECDGEDLGDNTCISLGYYGGKLGCNSSCKFDTSECVSVGKCGDDIVQADFNEECDNENLNGTDCESLGYHGGELSCDTTCHFDVSSCEQFGKCGDNIIQEGEQCDGNAEIPDNCISLGYYGGFISCDNLCRYDLSDCQSYGWCGNGIINAQEQCDGTELNDFSCLDLGYYGTGNLACTGDCQYDVSGCIELGRCGDGITDTEEECDGTDINGLTCLDLGYHAEGNLACTGGCQYDVSGCTAVGRCGDGIIQTDYEECDGSTFPGSCRDAGFWYGTPASCDASCLVSFGCNYAVKWGTSYNEYGESIISDSAGNLYIAGYTEGFLNGNLNIGNKDAFLTKYSSGAVRQWTRQWGTSDDDYAESAAMDSVGNIYVTGYTGGTLPGNTSSGNKDIFLSKYTADGTLLWTRQWGTLSDDLGYSVIVNNSGSIYVTGYTRGAFPGNTNSGGLDLFLSRYNSSGTLLWTRQWGTSSDDYAFSMAFDSSGNLYVTGNTDGAFSGNTNSGYADVFLSKFALDGARLWTRQWGTSGYDRGASITMDGVQNLYITGFTNGAFPGNTNAGGMDIFVTGYTKEGTELWTIEHGTSTNDFAKSITADNDENLYVTGYTSGGLDGNTNLGSEDIFLIKLRNTGVKLWTKQFGSSSSDYAKSVTVHNVNDIYITGDTKGSIDGRAVWGLLDPFVVHSSSTD